MEIKLLSADVRIFNAFSLGNKNKAQLGQQSAETVTFFQRRSDELFLSCACWPLLPTSASLSGKPDSSRAIGFWLLALLARVRGTMEDLKASHNQPVGYRIKIVSFI